MKVIDQEIENFTSEPEPQSAKEGFNNQYFSC